MTTDQVLAVVVGACIVVLLAVIAAVARPFIARWRVRHAIAYRAVVVALNSRWPGYPGCICFPGERGKYRNSRCLAKKHRA